MNRTIGIIQSYSEWIEKRLARTVERPMLVKTPGSGLMMIKGHRNLAKRTVALEAPEIMDVLSVQSFPKIG